MAENRELLNQGLLSGSYGGATFQDSQSSEVSVILADIPFTKSADQSVWLSGQLTFTLTVNNTAGEGPITGMTIRDALDTTKFRYVDGSVTAQITSGATVTVLTSPDDYTATLVPDGTDPNISWLQIVFTTTGAAASLDTGSVLTITFRGDKVPA